MEVIIGKYAGFCSGVRRAIKGVRKALDENERIYCLGEIIHNPEVIRSLTKRGMVVVDDVCGLPEKSHFIVRSHGVQRGVIERALEQGLKIHDFTCPKVKKIHKLVKKLEEEGYDIAVVGNQDHPEVQAITSIAVREVKVVERPEDYRMAASSRPIAVVVQTTFNPTAFFEITKKIIALSKKTLVHNTLCEETIKRQKEAMRLAGKVDFILVVGGKNSSNTKTLYDIVRKKVNSIHIESARELDGSMLKNVKRVGVISGASTPEEEVMRVVKTIYCKTERGTA